MITFKYDSRRATHRMQLTSEIRTVNFCYSNVELSDGWNALSCYFHETHRVQSWNIARRWGIEAYQMENCYLQSTSPLSKSSNKRFQLRRNQHFSLELRYEGKANSSLLRSLKLSKSCSPVTIILKICNANFLSHLICIYFKIAGGTMRRS